MLNHVIEKLLRCSEQNTTFLRPSRKDCVVPLFLQLRNSLVAHSLPPGHVDERDDSGIPVALNPGLGDDLLNLSIIGVPEEVSPESVVGVVVVEAGLADEEVVAPRENRISAAITTVETPVLRLDDRDRDRDRDRSFHFTNDSHLVVRVVANFGTLRGGRLGNSLLGNDAAQLSEETLRERAFA